MSGINVFILFVGIIALIYSLFSLLRPDKIHPKNIYQIPKERRAGYNRFTSLFMLAYSIFFIVVAVPKVSAALNALSQPLMILVGVIVIAPWIFWALWTRKLKKQWQNQPKSLPKKAKNQAKNQAQNQSKTQPKGQPKKLSGKRK